MIWLAGLAGVLLVALDQWVKHWARTWLKPLGHKPFINGFLRFTYTENQGAAFGMLQGARWFFLALTVVVLIVLCVYYVRMPRTRIYWAARIPMIVVIAGAFGNFIDRFRTGVVVDMFEFEFITFPIFNVADMCLVSGTIVLAFVLLFVLKETPLDGK